MSGERFRYPVFAAKGYIPENQSYCSFSPPRLFRADRYDLLMMLLLIFVGLLVIAGSIWADYKWRKWISERRRDRQ